MKSTKVQTLGAIPGSQSEHALMKVEKAHALIKKCTYNGGIRNIARQKTETITCNGQIPGLLKEKGRSLSHMDSYST